MRFSRQDVVFEKFNVSEVLKNKKIVIIGCGAIGSVLVELLVRSGAENLTLIDSDLVDETNLQRQIYVEEDIGKIKVKALKEKATRINSKANINIICELINKDNSEKLIEYDIIIDCTDNFEARKIINSFCEQNNKDWIYNAAIGKSFVSCIFFYEDKLFGKVFPYKVNNQDNCESGILGSTIFASASLVFNQILKYFTQKRKSVLIKYDFWENKVSKIKIN